MPASLFANSYIKKDKITHIHSFGNKSIVNVFELFFSIIVLKYHWHTFIHPCSSTAYPSF